MTVKRSTRLKGLNRWTTSGGSRISLGAPTPEVGVLIISQRFCQNNMKMKEFRPQGCARFAEI